MKVSVFWFRRDLRLEDNHGLFQALRGEFPVLPLFIYDTDILDQLEEKSDARVQFIYDQISKIHGQFQKKGSSILIKLGTPKEIFQDILQEFDVQAVYTNRDYEPYAKKRDGSVQKILQQKNIPFYTFKDQVIFEPREIQNGAGEFYKVFTPYSKVWLSKFHTIQLEEYQPMQWKNLLQIKPLPTISLPEIGFTPSAIKIPPSTLDEDLIKSYDQSRDFPAQNGTSRMGIHLRFGTVSIRKVVNEAAQLNATYLNELIWREFYMMILDLNPHVVDRAFKPAYDRIPWRNDEQEFKAWCEGNTGYPIVDAGMRELNQTGYMHNRVRMVAASFLTKHLLIDWRWGEAYFAQKLLDYELASNNGSWQWAAGTGTDAQPYFRVFNPSAQQAKFDKNWKYIKKWIPEINTDKYPKPIVDHKFARQRAIDTYKSALA